MQRSLLIGCGNDRRKKVAFSNHQEWAGPLTTVDVNPNCGADIVFDMARLPIGGRLPLDDGAFAEIGAFDCLEHWGAQGDFRGFFREFAEYHRLLQDGGRMFILVPVGPDALADPGHTRFFSAEYFRFLDREWYEKQIQARQPVTDYRWCLDYSFRTLVLQPEGNHHIGAILEKA